LPARHSWELAALNVARTIPKSQSPEDRPEQIVMSGKSQLRMSPFQRGELLPKRPVFQKEVTARTARLLQNHDRCTQGNGTQVLFSSRKQHIRESRLGMEIVVLL
jgi:hypothetical protein